MANYQFTQTGEQIQADLNKVEGMANIKSIGSGLSLDSQTGELAVSDAGTKLYKHRIQTTNEKLVIVLISTREGKYLHGAQISVDNIVSASIEFEETTGGVIQSTAFVKRGTYLSSSSNYLKIVGYIGNQLTDFDINEQFVSETVTSL